MSSELLRRAAAKLREHANAASPGPWTIDGDIQAVKASNGVTIAYDDEGEMDDGRYIALMHPPVALALAELLDHLADDLSDAGNRVEVGGLARNEYDTIRFDWTAALLLARAILREPEVAPGG